MNEYTWNTLREEAIELYGETPGAQLEQDIIQHFIEDPERVARTIGRIAQQHQRNPLRSPWAVLRVDLNRTAQADITVDATRSKSKLIDRAKRWIENAGCYYETWDAAGIELFGDDTTTAPLAYLQQIEAETRTSPGRPIFGPLLELSIRHTEAEGQQPVPGDTHAMCYPIRNDQRAREELERHWHDHRPHGIQAEQDHDRYNATMRDYHEAKLVKKQELREQARAELQAPEPEPVAVGAPDDDIDFD